MSFYSSSEKNDLFNIFPKKEDLSEYQNHKKLWNKIINKNSFNSQSDIFSSEDEIIPVNFYKKKTKKNIPETSFENFPNNKTADKNDQLPQPQNKNISINLDIIKKLNFSSSPKNSLNPSPSLKSQKSYSNSFKKFPKKNKKQITCKCKKTKCLKLYCDCFASQNMCSKSCKCQNCYNIQNYSTIKEIVVKELLQQNPLAFESKYKEIDKSHVKIHLRGCACKNSKCVKNYCECFLVNVKCTDLCRCLDCCNLGGVLGETVRDFKIVVKRRRKKKEFFLDGVEQKMKEYRIVKDFIGKRTN